MSKSFLQTQSWLKFQEAVGNKTFRFDDSEMKANIIKHKLPFGKSYLYIPHGPDLDLSEIKSGLKNEIKRFMDQLIALARQEGSIFIKIEPLEDAIMEIIYRRGFRLSKKQVQPYRTIVLDLAKDENGLLAEMHHKTRYNIGIGEKKGLIFEESKDIDAFLEILKKTAKADNFYTHNQDYYRKMMDSFQSGNELEAKLFLVKHEQKVIAGEIVLIYGRKSYYLHGAMDRDYKNLMAPYFMHWQIIKWLKSRGVENYDFWGIDAKKWPGVTRFKSGWGGRFVEYPGSFDLSISRFWFILYKLARKIG